VLPELHCAVSFPFWVGIVAVDSLFFAAVVIYSMLLAWAILSSWSCRGHLGTPNPQNSDRVVKVNLVACVCLHQCKSTTKWSVVQASRVVLDFSLISISFSQESN